MPQESQPSGAMNSKFGQNNVNTLVAMDEPEENTTIYAWRDDKLKKLPYDEHIAQTGQKIKTFYTFSKEEKVIIVTIDNRQMCLSITSGIIQDGEIEAGKPDRFFVNNDDISEDEYRHRVPIDNPVLFFSLNHDNFGEEIKGNVVRDAVTNKIFNEYTLTYGRYACAGLHKDSK